MHYYIYRITNLVNGKIYVGVHKTKNLNDGYMGSGKIIRNAIAKHGIENFTKDILGRFDTSDAMYAREKELVTDDFLARVDVYNLRRGGTGGFDYINATTDLVKRNKNINKNRDYSDPVYRNKLSIARKRIMKGKPFPGGHQYDWTGKHHTAKSKLKMSQVKKKYFTDGGKLSQLGTMWITNGIINKKIKNYDIIPEGGKRGRQIK